MKLWKRTLSCLLLLAMLCISAPLASATDDITGHWAETYLREMSAHNIIKSTSSGSFTPGAVISRAEFMRYINRAFGFTEKASINFSVTFLK